MKSLSRVWLFATLWTAAHQAPPSMGFSRQEYWSGFPFPSPGDLPDPGIKPRSPSLQADTLSSEPPGKLYMTTGKTISLTVWTFVGKKLCVCHSFPSKEQASFNLMAADTVHSDFGAQENKICHCFHFSSYLPWSDGTRCHDFIFIIKKCFCLDIKCHFKLF